jgi:hypothetical protein
MAVAPEHQSIILFLNEFVQGLGIVVDFSYRGASNRLRGFRQRLLNADTLSGETGRV